MKDVKEFIIEHFLFEDNYKLKNDTSFLTNNIIDSTGILELVNFIEETFNVKVEDDELIPDNLDSINKLEIFINSKINTDK